MIIKNNARLASPEIISPVRRKRPHRWNIWQRIKRYSGIGFLVAVGYMDPGNWATDIEAGSRFGYTLLFVVLLASITAMLLQTLCVRIGVASRKDLAQLCRIYFPRKVNFVLWVLAEIAIIACDFAEVLGAALALNLLFGLPLKYGVLITAFDTLIVLALQGRSLFKIKTLIITLVLIIGAVFVAEIILSQPDWKLVAKGLVPNITIFNQTEAWLLAIGIFGATVMPHNLYLHSAAVRNRKIPANPAGKKYAMRMMTADILITLGVAFFINAAILTLAAAGFHYNGYTDVKEINDAYYLLAPMLGTSLASVFFAIALFASGQSSTFTGTIAGQVIFEGFLNLSIPRWKQRFITRTLAVMPAWLFIVTFGDNSIGRLLVISQVVLSMQLPFAIIPLIIFSRSQKVTGDYRISLPMTVICSIIALGIISANAYLIWSLF